MVGLLKIFQLIIKGRFAHLCKCVSSGCVLNDFEKEMNRKIDVDDYGVNLSNMAF